MEENDRKALVLNVEFGEKISEELKALCQAFGSKAPGIKTRAAKAALEHMVKTYPEAIFAVVVDRLWDVLTIREKVMWFLCIGIVSKKGRESAAARTWEAYEREGRRPPPWAIADPKSEEVICVEIGLRKEPKH